jgi:hypothetical protein
MRDKTGKLLGSFPIRRTALGAGGYSFRPRFAKDGTLVIVTDSHQGFFRGPGDSRWTEMLRIGDNVAYKERTFGYVAGGTFDCTVHWANSDHMLTWFAGFLWRTEDRWRHAIKCGLPENHSINPNSRYRTVTLDKLAFDPASVDVFGFCDPTVGLRYTTDRGRTFKTHPDIPVGAAFPVEATPWEGAYQVGAGALGMGTAILFNRSSSVVGGRTQTVYIYAQGHGLYRSTTGIAGAFALVPGSPTDLRSLSIGPTGTIWGCRYLTLTKHKWTVEGGWVEITEGGRAVNALAHPLHPETCYFVGEGGILMATTDGKVIDRGGPGQAANRIAEDVPWLGFTEESAFSPGGGAFDPTNPSRMVIGQGISPWETFDPLPRPGANPTPSYRSLAAGMEQLCTMEHRVTPLGDLILAVQDRDFFVLKMDALDRYPHEHYPTGFFSHGQGLDWAGDDPRFLVGVSSHYEKARQAGYCHYSQDRGATWTPTATLPKSDKLAGNIAASTTRNWVWAQAPHGKVYYTRDGGVTWADCLFDGVPADGGTIFSLQGAKRQMVQADKDNPGHFYCYIWGDGLAGKKGSSGGLWKSIDGGATWARLVTGYLTSAGRDYWNCKLRLFSRGKGAAPDLFWTVGDSSGPAEGRPLDLGTPLDHEARVLFSRGGAQWTAIPGLAECCDVAIGKPYGDHPYPALYVFGWVKGVLGFYVCKNFDPADVAAGAWEMPGERFPIHSYDFTSLLSASMTTHQVNLGFPGSGLANGTHEWRLRAKPA